jgi:hypothetical protein
VGDLYATTGPADSLGWRNVLPKPPMSYMVEGRFQDVNVWDGMRSDRRRDHVGSCLITRAGRMSRKGK